MAKATQKRTHQPPALDDLSYGEALSRLEAVVEAMEEEDLPLEELLTRYEEGRRLADLCQTRLANAELRIQQLEADATGATTLTELSDADNADAEPPAEV